MNSSAEYRATLRQYRNLMRSIKRHGMTITTTTKSGAIRHRKRPEMKRLFQVYRKLRRLESKLFG